MALAPLKPRQSIALDGYITQQHFLRGQGSAELEKRIGYGSGRLKDGFYLLFLMALPKADEFEFRGYSHLPDGVPTGGTKNSEELLKDGKVDVAKLKAAVIKNTFAISGPKRLVKVLPIAGGSSYPPGSGIPQWKLTKKLAFTVAAVIAAGGKCP